MKIAPTFEIKVALIGNVSAGKTTVMNALFRDKFGEVSMKRTTAGVNYFSISTRRPQEWALVSDDSMARDAYSILKEITEDNAALRASNQVNQKRFEIQLDEELCDMRKDTRLVIADIPGINEAGASNKYKDYVTENWETFDCAIVVMDGRQGVNTEEQVSLLHLVKKNIDEKKDVPVIILCNKIDDPEDEEQAELVCEARREVEKIFGVEDREKGLEGLLEHDVSRELDSRCVTHSPVFIPISGITAFIFQSCSTMTLEKFSKFDEQLIAKLGRERIGKRKWRRLTKDQQIAEAHKAVSDPDGYLEGIADSNFDKFLKVFAYVVGGEAAQRGMIGKQIAESLKSLQVLPGIVAVLASEYKKMAALSSDATENGFMHPLLASTFWRLYKRLEDNAFRDFDGSSGAVHRLAPLAEELIEYFKFGGETGWEKEQDLVRTSFKQLVRRQIGTVLQKQSKYLNWTWTPFPSQRFDWKYLSPGDWENLFSSIQLLSYDKSFCQEFGRELGLIENLKTQRNMAPPQLECHEEPIPCPECNQCVDFNRWCHSCMLFVSPDQPLTEESSCPREKCGRTLGASGEECYDCGFRFFQSPSLQPDKHELLCQKCKKTNLDYNRCCQDCSITFVLPNQDKVVCHSCSSSISISGSSGSSYCECCRGFVKYQWMKLAAPTSTPSFEMQYKEGAIEPIDKKSYNDYFHIDIPALLSEPKHFGHLSWRFCEFMAAEN